MNESRGKQLIQELLSDSAWFKEHGPTLELLEEYFNGLSLETLRPLLDHNDSIIRNVASWIASEMGGEASSLIDEAIPLLRDDNPHTRYYALDVVMMGSSVANYDKFIYVVNEMHSDDAFTRRRAMCLVSNADVSQLEAAIEKCSSLGPSGELHKQGLLNLLNDHSLAPENVLAMIYDNNSLVRKYGAIAARRLLPDFPALITKAMESQDPDIRIFCEEEYNMGD